MKLKWQKEGNLWLYKATVHGTKIKICIAQERGMTEALRKKYVDIYIHTGRTAYLQCEVFRVDITADQIVNFCEEVRKKFQLNTEFAKHLQIDDECYILSPKDIRAIAYSIFGRHKTEVFLCKNGYDSRILAYAGFTPRIIRKSERCAYYEPIPECYKPRTRPW